MCGIISQYNQNNIQITIYTMRGAQTKYIINYILNVMITC